jgi:flavodoxin
MNGRIASVKEHVQPAAGKILVAYFSHSGNTRVIAEEIQKTVGGDLFRIEGVSPYPKDYNAVVEQAKQELSANVRPELTAKVDNMAAYQTIVIGYPIWWATMPMPVLTFLGSYDFSGKTIAPYSTHEGSGLGRSEDDIALHCPNSTVRAGLAVRGSGVRSAQAEVARWLRKIQIL